jgi:hypothetical protein
VKLVGLTSGKTYRFKAISRDRAGNMAVSNEYILTTLPAFTVSELGITPEEPGIGEPITISVLVTNNTDAAGSYELILRIGDAKDATQLVNLPGGAQERVDFATTRYSPGTFTVDVNGVAGAITVPAPPPKKWDWSVFVMIAGTTSALAIGAVGVLLRRGYFLKRVSGYVLGKLKY